MTELDEKQEIELESLYSGNLDLKTTTENPILTPIAEANNTFTNLSLIRNKALLDYEEIYRKIQEMVEENPRYSETMIVTTIFNLIIQFKQIVHSQDLQIETMKKTIQEMIKIVNLRYDLLGEEEEPIVKEIKKEKVETDEEVLKELNKIAKPKVSSLTDKPI